MPPVHVLCRYRVRQGKAAEFEQLVRAHWSTLHALGLTTAEPARLVRAQDKAGNVAFIELFSWADEGSPETAHQTPEVMRLWEPMGALCDDMEFWHGRSLAGAALWS